VSGLGLTPLPVGCRPYGAFLVLGGSSQRLPAGLMNFAATRLEAGDKLGREDPRLASKERTRTWGTKQKASHFRERLLAGR